jgi:type I restriction enzyme M protein
MTAIKQSDVNKAAWDACDTFRGTIDAANYKDYILVFLFWKYLSDIWADERQEAEKQYAGDKERIERRMSRFRFKIPDGASFHDLYPERNAANIGERVNIALEAIEDANLAKLEGVLTETDFNSRNNLGETADRNRRIKDLFDNFSRPALDFSPSRFGGEDNAEDVIGETYIYLISRFASDAGKKAGEFFTPRKISELLVRLADPQPGNRICDPACGSSTLLIRAAEYVRDIEGKEHASQANVQLFGEEATRQTQALARMNMFLHGLDSARIEWGDTLTNPKFLADDALMRFDRVLANPPFSLKKWGYEVAENDRFNRFHRGLPPKARGDYAFISHMVETAKPREGRVAVIAPHGVLFRGGAEGIIRRKLIEENLLDAVIGLPAQLFPSTGIPVCIVIFDRARENGGAREGADDVVFIDASRDFVPGKKQNDLLPEHLDRIVESYRKRENVERYAEVVSREDIRANDYNLNIPRYVDTFEAEEEVDVAAVQREIVKLERELAHTRAQMDAYLKELGVVQ